MNLVFIGSTKFSLRCLAACLEIPRLNITGIITAPHKFTISYRPTGINNVLYANMTSLASEHNIPVWTLSNSMQDLEIFEEVKSWKPNAFLVVGWYHMIPRKWRELAPAYGLHASLLPKYKGGAPLVWAMINGEKKTGITLFQMDNGVDSGPIVGQKKEPIRPDDTIATLYERIEERGLELIQKFLPRIVRNSFRLKIQDETKSFIMPQRSPEDGLIDWKMDAIFIDRFVRAQTKPYPGALTTLDSKPLHIWRTSVASGINKTKLGYIKKADDGTYRVTCGKGTLIIREISYENREYLQSQLGELFGEGGQILGH